MHPSPFYEIQKRLFVHPLHLLPYRFRDWQREEGPNIHGQVFRFPQDTRCDGLVPAGEMLVCSGLKGDR